MRSLATFSQQKMFTQTYPLASDSEDEQVADFHPCVSCFKMPQHNDEARALVLSVENLRETRSKNVARIEQRLRNYTMNSHMTTA